MRIATLLLVTLYLVCFITTVVVGIPLINSDDTTNNESSEKIASYTYGHNGRPSCETTEEINRSWRNNFDPTRFWYCVELGVEAIEIICPTGSGFINERYMCTTWSVWSWEVPFDPPTLA